jgi:hypothetical protein
VHLLAAPAHEGLPLADSQLAIVVEFGGQALAAAGHEPRRRLAEAAGQKGAESFAAPHQVGEAVFSLQLQGLLQGPEPGVGGRRI